MLMKRQLFLAGISLILGGMPMLAQDISPVNSVSYEWKSVPIVGGGFVDGIVFHPEAPGVRYCRTDMGGAYRWDAASNQWTPLLDWISLDESNLQGWRALPSTRRIRRTCILPAVRIPVAPMGPYFVLMMAAEPLPVSMCPLRWAATRTGVVMGNG